jgi:hypothetical protein
MADDPLTTVAEILDAEQARVDREDQLLEQDVAVVEAAFAGFGVDHMLGHRIVRRYHLIVCEMARRHGMTPPVFADRLGVRLNDAYLGIAAGIELTFRDHGKP